MSLICISPNGLDTYRLAERPDTMLVATVRGIVRLRRTGEAWGVESRSLTDLHVGSLMQDTATGVVFAGSYSSGLYRSRDQGQTWERAASGLNHSSVYSLSCASAADGSGNSELYAGTQPAHLYRSRDLGESWQEVMALSSAPGSERWDGVGFSQPPHVRHITCHPTTHSLYVCVGSGGLLRSEDGGEHFRPLLCQIGGAPLHAHARRVVFSPCDPKEIFLQSSRGVARSRDSGESWEAVPTGAMGVAYPDCVHYAPEGKGVFIAGAGTARKAWKETGNANAAISYSDDGGRTWGRLRGGLPRFTGNIEAVTLASWPGGFGFVFGTTDGQVFGSINKGETWKCLADAIPPVSTRAHHDDLAAGRTFMQHVYLAACRIC
jgi:photosystem II stability/assembly factor-like uncharacterized protein